MNDSSPPYSWSVSSDSVWMWRFSPVTGVPKNWPGWDGFTRGPNPNYSPPTPVVWPPKMKVGPNGFWIDDKD